MSFAPGNLGPSNGDVAPGAGEPGLVRRSSGEQAAFHIRRLIFDGQLRPGSRVPQDEIARTLGISRIPIREALIALEREGWVTNELHRGTFVNALNESTVRDHYQLFGLVYGFAARMAIERSDGSLAAQLSEIHRRMVKSEDDGEIVDLAVRFHATVVAAAGSPPTRVLLRSMSGLVPGNFFSFVPKAREIERRGLAAVLRAVRAGDSERAAGAYAQMMQRQGEQVVNLFRDRGLFEGHPHPEPVRRAR